MGLFSYGYCICHLDRMKNIKNLNKKRGKGVNFLLEKACFWVSLWCLFHLNFKAYLFNFICHNWEVPVN